MNSQDVMFASVVSISIFLLIFSYLPKEYITVMNFFFILFISLMAGVIAETIKIKVKKQIRKVNDRRD